MTINMRFIKKKLNKIFSIFESKIIYMRFNFFKKNILYEIFIYSKIISHIIFCKKITYYIDY